MAEIDKSLPNTATEVEIPEKEEIVDAMEAVTDTSGDTEVQLDEDGGATVNFDPSAVSPEGGEQHDANLAEYLEDKVRSVSFRTNGPI